MAEIAFGMCADSKPDVQMKTKHAGVAKNNDKFPSTVNIKVHIIIFYRAGEARTNTETVKAAVLFGRIYLAYLQLRKVNPSYSLALGWGQMEESVWTAKDTEFDKMSLMLAPFLL